MTPLWLESELIVALIIPAVLYVGAEEVKSCIDLRIFFRTDVKEMRLQVGK